MELVGSSSSEAAFHPFALVPLVVMVIRPVDAAVLSMIATVALAPVDVCRKVPEAAVGVTFAPIPIPATK